MTTTGVRTAAFVAPESLATRRQWSGLVFLSISIVLISIDQTVLNVALPTLVRALHPSGSGLQWIVDSYTLTNAVLIILGGVLGDRYGRKRIFEYGLAIFGGGSLASALVHSTGPLIAARACMGLGAAFLMPATLSLIAASFSGQQRAQAIGLWAGAGGIGTAAGPIVGGLLLRHFWWGSIFLINVPIAVVAFFGIRHYVDESRAEIPAPIDLLSVLLSAGGFATMTYALIDAPNRGLVSAPVLSLIGAAVLLLGAFAWWDGRAEAPLIDFSLFKNRIFSTAMSVVTACFFTLFALSFLISQYSQFVQGATVVGVALRFTPYAIVSLVAANLAARLTARFDLRPVLLTGLCLVTLALLAMTRLSVHSGYVSIAAPLALAGAGIGLIIAPASTAIINTLPLAKVGAGSGLRSMVQLLGGSFGVAILGSIATGRYRSQLSQAFGGPLAGLPGPVRAPVKDQIGQAAGVIPHLPANLAAATHTVTTDAFVSGMHLSVIIAVVGMVLATIASGVFLPRRLTV